MSGFLGGCGERGVTLCSGPSMGSFLHTLASGTDPCLALAILAPKATSLWVWSGQ